MYEIWTRYYNGDGRRLDIKPFESRERAQQHIEWLRSLASSRGISLGTMTYEVRPVKIAD